MAVCGCAVVARTAQENMKSLTTVQDRMSGEIPLLVGDSMSLSFLSEQLHAWREAGTFQRLRVLESPCEPVSVFDGREVINLASNNYLGLANHPKLVEASVKAAKKYGAGSGAVRTISGDRKSTRLNSSHRSLSRMPSSA